MLLMLLSIADSQGFAGCFVCWAASAFVTVASCDQTCVACKLRFTGSFGVFLWLTSGTVIAMHDTVYLVRSLVHVNTNPA